MSAFCGSAAACPRRHAGGYFRRIAAGLVFGVGGLGLGGTAARAQDAALLPAPPAAPASPIAVAQVNLGAPPLANPDVLPTPLTPAAPAPPPAGGTPPAWAITSSLNVSETYIDNVLMISAPRDSDIYTSINPSISIVGDTQRVQATAVYDPNVLIFPGYSGLNQIDENGAAQATITLVPETLFLSLQGFASTQATPGGSIGPFGYNPAFTEQITSFSVSPYLQHQFGDYGTGKLMYSFNNTNFGMTGLNGVDSYIPSSSQYPAYFNPFNGNLMTSEEQAQFTTGNFLGRLQLQSTADLQQYNGFGMGPDSYQNIYDNEFSYALTHSFALLFGGGWEDINYNMQPDIAIHDAIWDVGFKWKPNADSTVIATYGHKYGLTYPYLDGEYQLTKRTKINANYTEYLDTAPQAIQNNLANSTLLPTGQTTSTATGAPIAVANPFFALEEGLLQTKLFNAGITTAYDRDTFSLTGSHETDYAIAVVPGILSYSDRMSYGTLSWTHTISDDLTATNSFTYGPMSFYVAGQPAENFTTIQASSSLTYTISPTLSAIATYTYMEFLGNLPGVSATANMVTVGLTKTFQ
jgi:uncharacterized protein (PEP-CTERM system associated)